MIPINTQYDILVILPNNNFKAASYQNIAGEAWRRTSQMKTGKLYQVGNFFLLPI